jgi:hypothetical protein
LFYLTSRYWSAEQIALNFGATFLSDMIKLLGRLNSLRGSYHSQAISSSRDAEFIITLPRDNGIAAERKLERPLLTRISGQAPVIEHQRAGESSARALCRSIMRT